MDKVILNQNGFKKSSTASNFTPPDLGYGEKVIQDNVYYSLKAKFLAFGIFLYFFFENGTLGLLPEKFYMVYRSVRISDIILYVMVIYSIFRIKEYKDLFKSKSLIVVKVFLSYMVFEFIYSAFIYKFISLSSFAEKRRIGFSHKVNYSRCSLFEHTLYIKRRYGYCIYARCTYNNTISPG